ncbi:MAG: ribose-phosphate pyrophosphokinase [Anaerolineaceae bacterium]|nr:ribose-phosphate pyrophosphokinase [Anaerolineaceae bacterium]
MREHPLKIFTGTSHPELAMEIASLLNTPLGRSTTTKFPDSETHVTIDEAVRGANVFIIQPCHTPVNEHIVELLLYLDAFRRASVHEVTAVIPYFPYSRQERMSRGREAISAKVIASLIEHLGADRVIYMDIHNQAIQGFFNIPVDPLSAVKVISEYFSNQIFQNAAIVSPDVGRASMAGKYAELLNLPLVVMHKRRSGFRNVKTTHVVGDIQGRRPIIIDDMIASGSILTQLDELYQGGAVGKAYFAITHPILLPAALKLLNEDERIEKLVVTNTIPIPPEKMSDKIKVISVGPLLADIINRIHKEVSISERLVLS